VDVSKYELDHVCIRATSPEEYEEKKKAFLNDLQGTTLLSEAIISGRSICTFKVVHRRSAVLLVDMLFCSNLKQQP